MTEHTVPSGRPARILLGDDHTMFRQGLASLLDSYEDIEVIGSVPNGPEVISLAEQRRPDMVIMQIETPLAKAKENLSRLLALSPRPKVLIVTMFEDPHYVRELTKSGASAYLVKSAEAGELIGVIRAAAANPEEVNDVIVGMPQESLEISQDGYESALSKRELQVLLLAARGLSNRQIATELTLSEATVSRHLANIYEKVGVSSRSEASKIALAKGWISLSDIIS